MPRVPHLALGVGIIWIDVWGDPLLVQCIGTFGIWDDLGDIRRSLRGKRSLSVSLSNHNYVITFSSETTEVGGDPFVVREDNVGGRLTTKDDSTDWDETRLVEVNAIG